MLSLTIELPGNPATKKNSQQIIHIPVKGTEKKRPCIIPSKAYKEYESKCGETLELVRKFSLCREAFPITEPVTVTVTYYMETKRRVDLPNLLEATDDILVKYGILSDDNSSIVVSHDGSRVKHDKASPRAVVHIESAGWWKEE